MADLAIEAAEELLAEPEGAYAADSGGASVPSLDGRFEIKPEQELPHLSTSNARAFAAVDNADVTKSLYALVTDSGIPFRLNALNGSRDLIDLSVVKPVQWGGIDWPQTQRRETVIILERPGGEALMPSLDAAIKPLTVQEIADHLVKPMVALLNVLDEQGLAHRSIRPTNIFRSGGDGPFIAGEFFSAPPGFHQPAAFESFERAMCAPGGRGTGEIADDLFALGVTALFLSLGKNPVAAIDEKELLATRAQLGSYAAYTAGLNPPGDLAPAIRSLLIDNPRDRWTTDDLARWAGIGVAVQAKTSSLPRSERGFEFAGGQYHTGRELALAFSQNWVAARSIAQTDAIQRWAERSIENRELSRQLDECRHSSDGGPRMVSDDLLLARTIVTLDPEGPLRYRGLNVMPDGLGPMCAFAAVDEETAKTFKELLTSQLMNFWYDKQIRPARWAAIGKGDAEKMLAYLKKPGPGFAIERCVYEMNKGMACQSPRFKDANAVQIRDLMEALDIGAQRGEQQLDRHVAAFLAARYSGSIDSELKEFSNAETGEEALVAQLTIFAAVQFKHGPRKLPNLTALFFDHLDLLLAPFHNTELRALIRRSAAQVAESGKLPELLGVLRNRNYMRMDKKGFDRARQYYAQLQRSIRHQEGLLARIAVNSLEKGRVVAAYTASCICATVVVLVVLGGMG